MYYKPILIALLMMATVSLRGQVFERSKKYNNSFKVNPSTEINIVNKYGNIHLIQWDKDSVRMEVEVRVSDTKQAKVDKVFDEISVEFTQTPFYVIAKTSFLSSGSFWNELTDLTKAVLNTGNAASINYTVYLPDEVSIKIDNRFGSVYSASHIGNANIKVSNGNIQASEFKGSAIIDLEFGQADITSLQEANLKLNFAEVNVKTIEKLQLDSRSSTLLISEIETARIYSRRDKITIEKVISITGSASFSRINLGELDRELMLATDYGTLNLMKINQRLQYLQLTSNFTIVSAYRLPEVAAKVEITHSKKCRVQLPSTLKVEEDKLLDETLGLRFIKGSFGASPQKVLKFNLIGGELTIF